MTNHASELVLDELAAGLPADPASVEHVGGCERCRERLASIQLQRNQSQSAPEFRRVLRSLRPVQPVAWWRRRWLLPLAGVTAVAALLLLPKRPLADGDRIKGRTVLALVKEPTGEDVRGVVHPGEQVSLAVGSAGASNVIVMAVGEDGAVSKLWPLDRSESGPAPKGAAVKLAPSFIVTPGAAQLMAFFSEERLPAKTVEESLEAAVAEARRSGQSPIMASPAPIPSETGRATRLLCVEGSPCLSHH
jgi:hypothetical protein